MKNKSIYVFALAAMTIGLLPVWAQEPVQKTGETGATPCVDQGGGM